jgi:prevent-host-death family protein
MNTQTTISISEARKKIFAIAEDVQNPSVFYVLTEKGRPKVVVLSAEEFESWVETLEVTQDFPDLKKDVMAARADYKSENYITLNKYLNKPHAISGRPAKKGTKRSK